MVELYGYDSRHCHSSLDGHGGRLSVIVWRMLRDERERSEARVLALTAMAARPPGVRAARLGRAPRAAIAHPRIATSSI